MESCARAALSCSGGADRYFPTSALNDSPGESQRVRKMHKSKSCQLWCESARLRVAAASSPGCSIPYKLLHN